MATLKISTVQVQGKVGSNVRLGLPTDGSLSDGLVVLDENASVTEAIDELNEALGTAPEVTGSRGGNAALASLLTVLDTLGLITDNTTA